jgi:hypothetical protein
MLALRCGPLYGQDVVAPARYAAPQRSAFFRAHSGVDPIPESATYAVGEFGTTDRRANAKEQGIQKLDGGGRKVDVGRADRASIGYKLS